MKKLIMVCLAILLLGSMSMAKKNNPEGTSSIKFEEQVWDFGTIPNDRPAIHNFEFTNEGTGNLVIVKATAECGCTRPEYPDKPIAPGKKGKIKVTFNPAGQGSFEKTVTIRTNGSPKTVRLKIRGIIAPRDK